MNSYEKINETYKKSVLEANSLQETYMVAQNPSDKLWYIVGNTGKVNGKEYYMPVSSGYKSKPEAEKAMKKQYMADKDAKKLTAAI